MASPWVLVLDVGSSSIRARLFDANGAVHDVGPAAPRSYGWKTSVEGAMEVWAEELLELTGLAIDTALAAAREAELSIAAVGIASFWHTLVGVGADGEPVTPLLAWGDTRATPTALALVESLDEEAIHRRTGCFLHPSYPAVKLAWLRQVDPVAFSRARWWGSFAEYLERALFGEHRCSYSMASGTGLLDVRRLEWDSEMLEVAGIRAGSLSPLVDVGAAARGLREPFAGRWPELASIPWFPAVGDGACANLGSGATGPRRLGLTLGTTAAVRALWEPAGELQVPDSLWCYRLDARRCVAGGALSNGGNAFAFLQRSLRLAPTVGLEAALARLGPDEHGLTVLPYLVGERGPGWVDELSAAVVGITQATTPVQLVRAWMEAVAYRLARVHARLEGALGNTAAVHASGGAVNASPTWARILADVLGRPLWLTGHGEDTSRGAALLAQEQLGWRLDPLADPPPPAAVVEPHAARHVRYQTAMRRQDDLQAVLSTFLRPPTE